MTTLQFTRIQSDPQPATPAAENLAPAVLAAGGGGGLPPEVPGADQPAAAPGAPGDPGTAPSFLNVASLTFAGLATVGSILMPLAAALFEITLPNLYLAAVIALVLGGAVIVNEFINPKTRLPANQVFATLVVGLLNIAILTSTYLGVSAVANGLVPGTP